MKKRILLVLLLSTALLVCGKIKSPITASIDVIDSTKITLLATSSTQDTIITPYSDRDKGDINNS